MEHKLKINSYNCRSLNSNAQIVQSLLKDLDILCLQETLIDENNHDNLDKLDPNFMYAYVPAFRKADCFVGRSSGGLAIMWRRPLNFQCVPFTFDKRIMGLKITFGSFSILILNVYFICDYGNTESLIEYKSTMATLGNIIENEVFDEVICMGDFNADPNKGRFYSDFQGFCRNNHLHPYDILWMPIDSYTYISANSVCSSSWLDHIICSDTSIISNCSILYGVSFSDHIPISFDLAVPYAVSYPDYDPQPFISKDFPKVNWDKVNDHDKNLYAAVLDDLCLEVCYGILSCDIETCKNSHFRDLDNIYSDLIECIFSASLFLPNVKNHRKENFIVGWNNHCKEKYAVARGKYLEWHVAGRVRHGRLFEDMKSARVSFKNALNYCKNNEAMIRKQNLLQKFSIRNKKYFWKEVSKIHGNNPRKVVQIEGKSDLKEITSLFDGKYREILDDSRCQGGTTLPSSPPSFNPSGPIIGFENVYDAILRLNDGIGWDGIHANHLKFSGPIFKNLLTKFVNKILFHCHFPNLMLHGEIRPVIKNKVMGKNDSNNYRPVMNSGMFLKIFEYCLLPEISRSLLLSKYQFGFRANTSCMSAVAVVKEVISKYNKENSDVHAALIDMSKAFDRINIHILIKKLGETTLNPVIIDAIYAMYTNSYVNTSFNNVKSDSWKVGNGVRQGGILSPLLFGFYLNYVIEEISCMPIGCSLNFYKLSVLGYADDLILLAPSAAALQIMVNKLELLIADICLTLNPKKSVYIVFRHKNCKFLNSPTINICGENLKSVKNCKYLGVELTSNGDMGKEVNRVTNSFLKQFNGFFSKFYFAEKRVLFFLFKSYTTSFYGIDLWPSSIRGYDLNKISVAYHKAVKRICGLYTWNSNHEACEIAGVLIFKHLLAKRKLCFWHNLLASNSPCLLNLKYFFRHQSCMYEEVSRLFTETYSVDISSNPLCSILARIEFVQRNEPRSYYIPNND